MGKSKIGQLVGGLLAGLVLFSCGEAVQEDANDQGMAGTGNAAPGLCPTVSSCAASPAFRLPATTNTVGPATKRFQLAVLAWVAAASVRPVWSIAVVRASTLRVMRSTAGAVAIRACQSKCAHRELARRYELRA
jgi:hypothetical protein